jgi:hypothetical protein
MLDALIMLSLIIRKLLYDLGWSYSWRVSFFSTYATLARHKWSLVIVYCYASEGYTQTTALSAVIFLEIWDML